MKILLSTFVVSLRPKMETKRGKGMQTTRYVRISLWRKQNAPKECYKDGINKAYNAWINNSSKKRTSQQQKHVENKQTKAREAQRPALFSKRGDMLNRTEKTTREESERQDSTWNGL